MECSKPSLAPFLIARGFLISVGRFAVSIINWADHHFEWDALRGRNTVSRLLPWLWGQSLCLCKKKPSPARTVRIRLHALLFCLCESDLLTWQSHLACQKYFPASGNAACQPRQETRHLHGRDAALLLAQEPPSVGNDSASQSNIDPLLAEPSANLSSVFALYRVDGLILPQAGRDLHRATPFPLVLFWQGWNDIGAVRQILPRRQVVTQDVAAGLVTRVNCLDCSVIFAL